jgi:hypothetical protein
MARDRLAAFGFAALGSFVLLFLMFEWLAVEPYGRYNVTYYEEQADAFLAGQTALLRAPPDGLLALPDPWDADANARFREPPDGDGPNFPGVHDLSLYHGKLYLEWGPVPSLVLIPLRWVIGPGVPMGHLTLVVATLALLAYARATFVLARLCRIPVGGGIGALLFLQFLICPVWLFVLHRIRVYEVGICFDQLCMSLALLCTVEAFDRRLRQGKAGLWLLAAASLLLGCLVNCRLGTAPFGLLVPIVWVCWLKSGKTPIVSVSAVGSAAAIGLPAAALLGAALVYNQIRFDNFLEAGQTWQLWGGHGSLWQKQFHYLALARFLPNIWYFFLAPVQPSPGHGPFVAAPLILPASWMGPDWLRAYDIYAERMSGLFVVMPLLLLLPVGFLRAVWRGAERGRLVVVLLLLCAVVSAALLFLAPAVMRYGAEWCMWLLMAAILVLAQLRSRLGAGARRLLDGGIVLSTLWTAYVGVSFLI